MCHALSLCPAGVTVAVLMNDNLVGTGLRHYRAPESRGDELGVSAE